MGRNSGGVMASTRNIGGGNGLVKDGSVDMKKISKKFPEIKEIPLLGRHDVSSLSKNYNFIYEENKTLLEHKYNTALKGSIHKQTTLESNTRNENDVRRKI
jgi:hypothetical protein